MRKKQHILHALECEFGRVCYIIINMCLSCHINKTECPLCDGLFWYKKLFSSHKVYGVISVCVKQEKKQLKKVM